MRPCLEREVWGGEREEGVTETHDFLWDSWCYYQSQTGTNTPDNHILRNCLLAEAMIFNFRSKFFVLIIGVIPIEKNQIKKHLIFSNEAKGGTFHKQKILFLLKMNIILVRMNKHFQPTGVISWHLIIMSTDFIVPLSAFSPVNVYRKI